MGEARQWLKQMRVKAKKSQQSVANEAGISQSYYAGIEDGSRGKPVSVPIAKAIASALHFDWTRFYSNEDGSETSIYRTERREQTKMARQNHLTDEEVEAEILRLKASPLVALAAKEQRIKYIRRQYMYTLRNLEKRGQKLVQEGITMDILDAMAKESKSLRNERGERGDP